MAMKLGFRRRLSYVISRITVHPSVGFTKKDAYLVGIVSKAAKIRTEHHSRHIVASCDQMAFVLSEVLQLYPCRYFYLTSECYSNFQKETVI
jgi:hypothetical protein